MNISKLKTDSVSKTTPVNKVEDMECNWIYVIFGL